MEEEEEDDDLVIPRSNLGFVDFFFFFFELFDVSIAFICRLVPFTGSSTSTSLCMSLLDNDINYYSKHQHCIPREISFSNPFFFPNSAIQLSN